MVAVSVTVVVIVVIFVIVVIVKLIETIIKCFGFHSYQFFSRMLLPYKEELDSSSYAAADGVSTTKILRYHDYDSVLLLLVYLPLEMTRLLRKNHISMDTWKVVSLLSET